MNLDLNRLMKKKFVKKNWTTKEIILSDASKCYSDKLCDIVDNILSE